MATTGSFKCVLSAALKSTASQLLRSGSKAELTAPCFSCQRRRYAVEVGVKKSTKLRKMLLSPELEFIMEAHSGISACIAEEAGFQGIWASGLSMATQLGVRDSNEASWTQVLEVLEFMNDACTVPILVDADTGYGNFNNARRLVRKLEDRGIAGAAVEDKLFPKTNSLLDGRAQPLADIKEFALKIQAMKDAQRDPDFNIVARVEALIAGWGVDEALKRADAYLAAGATAILMHSKLKEPKEIDEFLKAWQNKGPIVIVPTTYYKTPMQHWREQKVSMVIWANHSVRASVKAMQDLTAQIFKEQSTVGVENKIATVKELFRLTKDDELKLAEDKYLPQN
ncbi:phosphoenolpyruvate phosphomutase-like [Physella acuta]|uniref:phosphoenolpyruvate phosphomutase-like n=1 Tax=Physella acuta TaxID=109671 RepID=UPI0027DE2694|nr:phosphoenolpyruvate phosphomutase-like [Physella acuta]